MSKLELREAIKIVEDIVKYHFTVKDMNQEALTRVVWKAKESVNYDLPDTPPEQGCPANFEKCEVCGHIHANGSKCKPQEGKPQLRSSVTYTSVTSYGEEYD